MFLGINYIVWIILLGMIFVILLPKGKRNELALPNAEELDEYVKNVNAMNEMRWFKVVASSEQVPEVLNKIETAKITVMYQFFLNQQTGLYDLFFRCKQTDLDRIKGIMKDFI